MAHTDKSYKNQNSPAAIAYAKSLLELANERGLTEAIGLELTELAEIIRQNPSFEAFLSDPGISIDERRHVLDRVFMPNVSPLMKNFIGVLNMKNAIRLFNQIADAYDDLYSEQIITSLSRFEKRSVRPSRKMPSFTNTSTKISSAASSCASRTSSSMPASATNFN
jgi:hypothetical protein